MKGRIVMAKKKTKETETVYKPMRPALSSEARENQMINLAIELAEQQLRDGTASSQVITHYLKLGTTKEKIEKEILERQKELITAKTEQIRDAKKTEEMYQQAISAMQRYSGNGGDEDDDEEDEEYY